MYQDECLHKQKHGTNEASIIVTLAQPAASTPDGSHRSIHRLLTCEALKLLVLSEDTCITSNVRVESNLHTA